MSKLDEFIEIVNDKERKNVLVKYARRLGISGKKLKEIEDHYDEQKLIVAIFDAERTYDKNKTQNLTFTVAGAAIFIVMTMLLFLMPRWMSGAYQDGASDKAEKYMDMETQSIIQQKPGQKEYAVVMNGIYEETDAKGVLRAEYVYDEGILKQKRIYNKRGVLSAVENY